MAPSRAAPSRPRWWLKPLQVAVLLAAIVGVGRLALKRPGELPAPQSTRPGWTVIRPPHEVSALVEEGDVVWAGGRDGLTGIRKADLSLVRPSDKCSDLRYVHALLVDGDGGLWIGHERGLTLVRGDECYTLTTQDGLPSDVVNALLRDADGRLWAGTSLGAAHLEGGRWQALTTADGLLHDMVNAMAQSPDGSLWFGSYVPPGGGLSVRTKQGWQHFSTDNGLPHNAVTSMLANQAGDVWVGLGFATRGGACRFTLVDGRWRLAETLTVNDGLAGPKVRSLYEDPGGGMWFGSERNGIACLKGGAWHVIRDTEGLAHNEVKCFLEGSDGALWLGTADGVTYVSPEAAHNETRSTGAGP